MLIFQFGAFLPIPVVLYAAARPKLSSLSFHGAFPFESLIPDRSQKNPTDSFLLFPTESLRFDRFDLYFFSEVLKPLPL